MSTARCLALVTFLSLLLSSTVESQQVWIEDFPNVSQPGEKPNGLRFDYADAFPVGTLQLFARYTRVGSTCGFDAFVNNGAQQFSCGWTDTPGGGTADCFVLLPYSCGKLDLTVRRCDVATGLHTSSAVEVFSFDTQQCLPQCDSCQLLTIGQGPGKPVNVATGKLWYRTTDLALSGPFGLSFSRWYDNQANFSDGLGFGWRHSYSASLDVTLAGGTIRRVTLRDEEGRVTYFTGLLPGGSVHDQTSGSDLARNAAGTIYTLSTWSGTKYTFDSAGRLTSLIDRIGNTQTITRDASQRIDLVTDVLGRQLDFGYDASNRIVSVATNPPGLSLSFSYTGANCPAGNLCTATMPDNQTWTYEYTASGNNLTKVMDPNGNAEEINTYTGERIATQKTQDDQNLLTFTYPNATTTTVTDALNRQTAYTYNPKLLVVTNVAGPGCACGGGQSRAFTFDQFLRKTSETDGLGATHKIDWTYGRDLVATYPGGFTDIVTAYPSPSQRTEPLSSGVNRATSWTYYPLTDSRRDLADTETVPSADTPGVNKVTTFTYNTQGLLTSRQEQGRIGGVVNTYTTAFTYDTKGRLLTANGPRTDVTDVTTSTYFSDTDANLARRGQLRTVTDAVALVTTYAEGSPGFNTYTLYGQPRHVKDPNDVERELTYDNRGRLTLSKLLAIPPWYPTNLSTSYQYDPAGRLQRVLLPNGNDTFYVYDGSNRLREVIRRSPDPGPTQPFQRERLRITPNVMSEKVLEEAQVCTTPAVTCTTWVTRRSDAFQYDGFGRLWQVNHPDSSTIFYTYDAAGNLHRVRDENHATPNTTYGYDFGNRLTSVTQTLQGAPGNEILTSYGYDIQDNLNSVTDPNANATTYLFDDFRRMRRQTSPVTGVTNYTHDQAGNLSTLTDANLATTTRVYDVLNRVVSAQSVRSGLPSQTVTFGYDNPLAEPVEPPFVGGRLSFMSDPTGSTEFAYERRGLVRKESRVLQGNSYSLSYAYDGNGNRSRVTYPSGLVVNYTFDFADRPLSSTPSSGTAFVTSAKYRPFGPLEQIRYGNGTTKTMDYDSRYRPTLNKLEKDSPLTTLAHYTLTPDFVGNIDQITDVQNAGYNRTYDYDDLHRLTTTNSGASLWGNGSTAYDRMGNLTSLILGTARTATFAYVGTTPKLSSVTESGIGTRNVTYDSGGNETQVGTGGFTYSARNYLANGEGFSYAYDANGLRCVATNATARRYSFYSPEMNLLAETYLTTATTPSIQHEYIWFAGQPVAQIDDGTPDVTSWDFTDHLGTPFIQTNSAATVLWRAEYEPYGRIFALRTPNRHQPLRLPGQEAEELNVPSTDGNGATERSYNIFRWYRSRWGRYSQGDPIGLASGANLFMYADDRPTRELDPNGLLPIGFDFGVAAKAGCLTSTFLEARRKGQMAGIGWRWAHCWASCTMVNICGVSQRGGTVLGFGKEIGDFIGCSAQVALGSSGFSGQCESAFQATDFADNQLGRECPAERPCELHCEPLRGRDASPGPFFGMGAGPRLPSLP